jgi:osmotically-inducible protein OsmY
MAAPTLVASCATAPPQATATPAATAVRAELGVTDEVLANAVYADLNADPKYYFRHVDVTVDNGVAHLSGFVWSTDAIYRARTIARNVPGVTGVVTSQLELERNGRDNGGVAR